MFPIFPGADRVRMRESREGENRRNGEDGGGDAAATAVPTSVVLRPTLGLARRTDGGRRFDLACYSASRAGLRQMRFIYTTGKGKSMRDGDRYG